MPLSYNPYANSYANYPEPYNTYFTGVIENI